MPSKLYYWKQIRGLMSTIAASAGIMPTANLGSGTADATTFLRGDQSFFRLESGGSVLTDPAGSGTCWIAPVAVTTASTQTLTTGFLYLVPFRLAQRRTFTQFGLPTISGSGNVRCGIYSAHATTNLPETLLVDAGSLAVAAATTVISTSFSLTLEPGLYYFAMVSNAGPSVRAGATGVVMPLIGVVSSGSAVSNIQFLLRAKAFGALDASETGNTYAATTSNMPFGLIR